MPKDVNAAIASIRNKRTIQVREYTQYWFIRNDVKIRLVRSTISVGVIVVSMTS